jgi:hypothetical protein
MLASRAMYSLGLPILLGSVDLEGDPYPCYGVTRKPKAQLIAQFSRDGVDLANGDLSEGSKFQHVKSLKMSEPSSLLGPSSRFSKLALLF